MSDWKYGDVLWPKRRSLVSNIKIMFIGPSDEVAGPRGRTTLFRATVLFDDHHYVKPGDADGLWEVELWTLADAED